MTRCGRASGVAMLWQRLRRASTKEEWAVGDEADGEGEEERDERGDVGGEAEGDEETE